MNPLERARFDLKMILPYVASLRRKAQLPDGNSLCYLGEKDGHFQVAEIDKIPQDQEIVLFDIKK
jgi:hypothetical protein